MNMQYIKDLLLKTAQKSSCKKRKVAAVLIDANGTVVSTGYNMPIYSKECEDSLGNTLPDVQHAEVVAIRNIGKTVYKKPLTMYVTHPPCLNCTAALEKAGISNVHVVEEFIKFDKDKLRYDLLPPEWHELDAKIITHGAKKYKPNNWKQVDDINRYVAALERHLIAYRKGEFIDPDSGLPHLAHVRVNAGFLLTLEEMKNED